MMHHEKSAKITYVDVIRRVVGAFGKPVRLRKRSLTLSYILGNIESTDSVRDIVKLL